MLRNSCFFLNSPPCHLYLAHPGESKRMVKKNLPLILRLFPFFSLSKCGVWMFRKCSQPLNRFSWGRVVSNEATVNIFWGHAKFRRRSECLNFFRWKCMCRHNFTLNPKSPLLLGTTMDDSWGRRSTRHVHAWVHAPLNFVPCVPHSPSS